MYIIEFEEIFDNMSLVTVDQSLYDVVGVYYVYDDYIIYNRFNCYLMFLFFLSCFFGFSICCVNNRKKYISNNTPQVIEVVEGEEYISKKNKDIEMVKGEIV